MAAFSCCAAILLLEGDGKLSTSDPLCRFLDPCPTEWAAVEIHHLLSHTSGVPDLFEEVADAPVEETVAEIYRAIEAQEDLALAWTPGESYAYINFGYMLLGAVIEAASGLYYEDFLRQSIWEPLGLANTRYDRVWEIVEGRARGYTREDGRLLNIEYDDPCAYGAGGLLSTPRDLARFARAISSGELLGAAATRRALTPVLQNYGLGWVIAEHFGHRVVWHNGGIGGFASQLLHYPEEDLTVVVLSNVENANADGVACTSSGLLFGETPIMAAQPVAIELSPDLLAAYAGSYDTDVGERVLTVEGGHLLYRGRTPLRPIGPGLFQFERPDHYHLILDTDTAGAPGGFVIEACGAVILNAERRDSTDDG